MTPSHIATALGRNYINPAEDYSDVDSAIIEKHGTELARLVGAKAWQTLKSRSLRAWAWCVPHINPSTADERPPMSAAYILYGKPESDIARIVLNRPETANAQDTQFLYELNDAFDRAAQRMPSASSSWPPTASTFLPATTCASAAITIIKSLSGR